MSDKTFQIAPIFDYTNGRRFQIIVVNKEPNELFTVHRDTMQREYVKLKLTEADIMQLLKELRTNLVEPTNDPKILEAKFRKNRLKIVEDGD